MLLDTRWALTYLAAQFVIQAIGTGLIVWGSYRLWRATPIWVAPTLRFLKLVILALALELLVRRALALAGFFLGPVPIIAWADSMLLPWIGSILVVGIGSQMVRLANIDLAAARAAGSLPGGGPKDANP